MIVEYTVTTDSWERYTLIDKNTFPTDISEYCFDW